MKTEATNEYHAKIEYASQVLSYLDYIEQNGTTNPLLFLRQLVESDVHTFTKHANNILSEMETMQSNNGGKLL